MEGGFQQGSSRGFQRRKGLEQGVQRGFQVALYHLLLVLSSNCCCLASTGARG